MPTARDRPQRHVQRNSSGDFVFLEEAASLLNQRQSSTIGHQVCQAGWLSGEMAKCYCYWCNQVVKVGLMT